MYMYINREHRAQAASQKIIDYQEKEKARVAVSEYSLAFIHACTCTGMAIIATMY